MKALSSGIAFLMMIALGLCMAETALAQSGYPEHVDDYINDFARVIKKADKQVIRETLDDLDYQTGIQMVVVTINSIQDYNTGDTSIESFATNLFNTWGVGSGTKNNGVLIVLSVKDRKVRIELGKGYGHYYDSAMKEVIDTRMTPYFKEGDYSRGLFEGVMGVKERVTKEVSWLSFYKWHILLGVIIVVCVIAGISCMRSGRKGWGWVFFIVAGILLIFLIKMIASGKRSGFGGGSSFGGGASGSW